MSDASDEIGPAHTAFAKAAFNATWDLIETSDRTPVQDREMLTRAFAARWHWGAVGTAENIVVSDWQVGHVASLVGEASIAMTFAQAAYDAARTQSLPGWLRASTAEGLARSYALAGDRASYQRYVDEARALLDELTDDEDRDLITAQLASIPPP